MAGKAVGWSIEAQGASGLMKKLAILGEPDAPYLRGALTEGGGLLEHAAAGHAKGDIAAKFSGPVVRPFGGSLRAIVTVKHPGARSMEFGRFNYYRGYKGRSMKATGQRFAVAAGRGQKARPMFGIIKGDAAVGQVGDQVRELITQAVAKEWETLGGDGA